MTNERIIKVIDKILETNDMIEWFIEKQDETNRKLYRQKVQNYEEILSIMLGYESIWVREIREYKPRKQEFITVKIFDFDKSDEQGEYPQILEYIPITGKLEFTTK
jgi:hypothetical protein